MILLKDANLLQIFAAYTLLIGHSPKEETIIGYIKFRPISTFEADVTTVLNGHKETSSDTLRHILDYELPNLNLVEATQKDSRYLNEAIVAIVCKYYSKQEGFELIYYLEGEGKFRLEISGLKSNIHNARKILAKLGYDKWRIYKH